MMVRGKKIYLRVFVLHWYGMQQRLCERVWWGGVLPGSKVCMWREYYNILSYTGWDSGYPCLHCYI